MPIATMLNFEIPNFYLFFKDILPCYEKLPTAVFQADRPLFRGGGLTRKVFIVGVQASIAAILASSSLSLFCLAYIVSCLV